MSKNGKKTKRRGFYGRVLGEAEKVALKEAVDVEGIDEEIAILRLKLRELIQNQPEKYDMHLKVINSIARLVSIRYDISKEQRKSLKEAITKVLTEIAVPLGMKMILK